MGIIRAAAQAVGGSLADQWLEVYEPDDMGDQTVFTSGVKIRKGQNTKGTDQTVSNGSIIHVYDNQMMLLVDGGKVVDYTAEPGYYKVDNSSRTVKRKRKRNFFTYQVRRRNTDITESFLYQFTGNQGYQVWNQKSGNLFRQFL